MLGMILSKLILVVSYVLFISEMDGYLIGTGLYPGGKEIGVAVPFLAEKALTFDSIIYIGIPNELITLISK
jgi:hypothetical protein